MRYRVKGDLAVTYYVAVETEVEAESEDEAVTVAANEAQRIVVAEPEQYMDKKEWHGDSPVVERAPQYRDDDELRMDAEDLRQELQRGIPE